VQRLEESMEFDSRSEGAHRTFLCGTSRRGKVLFDDLFQTLHVWLPSLCASGAQKNFQTALRSLWTDSCKRLKFFRQILVD
jgi:hypothetical protein